ncbi:aminotransferase class I/II-fold pyridoxal phosphate-dependent enzyme [Sandaracinus amylolyticus]|uniref:aminotransferase class I/II-fold pyridoxal phosphate-dependent enzyme n=1 Tax=Sandaracinus amylolyticus TaxID=927083 RepID=UPI001F1F796A|nr:aminotransferase class I/II-fold pyridoxal phosphate-dependent enzyme [Sandaracinus amylolyticus]UJR78423.1 Aminotransferase [Sandaracinus amylolyticus]
MSRWARLERWMAPQERFEEVRAAAFRRAGTSLCDLAYANAWDGPPPRAIEAMQRALDQRHALDLQYTPYGGHTVPRRLVAQQLARDTGVPFRFDDVVLTPGAMAALTIVLRWLSAQVDHGEVIIPVPCWLDVPLYAEDAGLVPVLVPLDPRTLRLDLDAVRAALSPRTVALVLAQPGNPSGVIHSRAELEALSVLLSEHPSRPILVSDECHRGVLFERDAWAAPAAIHPRTIVVHSFGKTSFLQGQRIGYAAVSPHFDDGGATSRDLARACRVTGVCTPTALMQRVVSDLLDVAPDMDRLSSRRDLALDALRAAGLEVQAPQATFFVYPRAPRGDAWGFVERLASRGVLVLPSEVFHHEGHVRLSLTGTDAMLERGLAVIAEEASR